MPGVTVLCLFCFWCPPAQKCHASPLSKSCQREKPVTLKTLHTRATANCRPALAATQRPSRRALATNTDISRCVHTEGLRAAPVQRHRRLRARSALTHSQSHTQPDGRTASERGDAYYHTQSARATQLGLACEGEPARAGGSTPSHPSEAEGEPTSRSGTGESGRVEKKRRASGHISGGRRAARAYSIDTTGSSDGSSMSAAGGVYASGPVAAAAGAVSPPPGDGGACDGAALTRRKLTRWAGERRDETMRRLTVSL